MNTNISILIVDDHDTIVSGLKFELLNHFKHVDFSVAQNTIEALEFCKIKAFEIAIVDISFVDETNADGLDLVSLLKEQYSPTKVISYSGYVDRIQYINQLKKVEADAIVSKLDGNMAIKAAIEQLLQGQIPYYSLRVVQAINTSNTKKNIHISKREKDVVRLLQKHLTYKEIAEHLGISKNTVDFHAKNLYSKLGVRKASELLEKVVEYL